MLKIYGIDFSPAANAVRMCANALGLDYQYKVLDVFEGEHKTDAYLALNPFGKLPVIDDDGFLLFESSAIVKYLSRKAGSSLYPDDPLEQAIVDQWASFVSVHIYMALVRVLFNKIAAPRFGLPVDENSMADGYRFLEGFLPVIEGQLGKTAHLAGEDLSVADILLLSNLDPAEMITLDLSPYPRLSAWRDRLRAEDFYLKVHEFYGETMMDDA